VLLGDDAILGKEIDTWLEGVWPVGAVAAMTIEACIAARRKLARERAEAQRQLEKQEAEAERARERAKAVAEREERERKHKRELDVLRRKSKARSRKYELRRISGDSVLPFPHVYATTVYMHWFSSDSECLRLFPTREGAISAAATCTCRPSQGGAVTTGRLWEEYPRLDGRVACVVDEIEVR